MAQVVIATHKWPRPGEHCQRLWAAVLFAVGWEWKVPCTAVLSGVRTPRGVGLKPEMHPLFTHGAVPFWGCGSKRELARAAQRDLHCAHSSTHSSWPITETTSRGPTGINGVSQVRLLVFVLGCHDRS